jgi:hypothetical protein
MQYTVLDQTSSATQLCVHLMCELCTELADICSTAMPRQVPFIETSSLISPKKVFCNIIYKLFMKNRNWLYCEEWKIGKILMV